MNKETEGQRVFNLKKHDFSLNTRNEPTISKLGLTHVQETLKVTLNFFHLINFVINFIKI